MWTAWQLKQLAPGRRRAARGVALRARPSGRNGGFCETLWGDLPTLRERALDEQAVEVCHASEDAVHAIGAWCDAHGVDAWYRLAPMLRVATTPSQVGSWDRTVEGVRRRRGGGRGCLADDRGGAPDVRLAALSRRARYRTNATVHPAPGARSASQAARGRSPRSRAKPGARVVAAGRRDDAARARTRRRRGARGHTRYGVVSRAPALTAVASSHIVLTEPVPEVLDELGWTGGEAIVDSRTLVHYMRTTRTAASRSAGAAAPWGWAGGLRAGSRSTLTSSRGPGQPRSFLPAATRTRGDTRVGGPIDVSPTHLPIFGSRGHVHYGFGFTGNGSDRAISAARSSPAWRSTGAISERGSRSSNRRRSVSRPSPSVTSAGR